MKRFILSISIISYLLLVFTSCATTGSEPAEATTETKNNKIQIGMTFDSFVIERWQRDRDAFVARAFELGAEVNVQSANGDLKEQISQIDYFIKQKVDVIVIVAVNSTKLKDVVKRAKKHGIKVIAYDRMLTNANADLYISFDNEKVGKLMGDSMKKAIPKGGCIVFIEGPTTDPNVEQVKRGVTNTLKDSSLELIAATNAENWKAEKAFDFIEEHLEQWESIDGVICGNDNLAGQAIKALAVNRLAGNVKVVGQDADLEACQRIVEGTQLMTVYKPIETLAKRAAECAVSLAKGETIENCKSIQEGNNVIPYVAIEPQKVTKENMEEVIIDSGFHLRDEVYLNK